MIAAIVFICMILFVLASFSIPSKPKTPSFSFWCSECGNDMANDADSRWAEEKDIPIPVPRKVWVKCGRCAVMHVGSLDIIPGWYHFATDIPFKIGYP